MKKTEQIVGLICGAFLLFVVLQSVFPSTAIPKPKPVAPALACIGTAIPVAYAYLGTVNDPWDCKVQCDDQRPRYILYTNGKATQCETPPGCNDFGEDNAITCNPPNIQSVQ